jgi:hypothetical protein
MTSLMEAQHTHQIFGDFGIQLSQKRTLDAIAKDALSAQPA